VSDPKPTAKPTPDELRALADRLEKRAQGLLLRAKQIRGTADAVDEIWAEGQPDDSDLPSVADDATIRQPMQAQKTQSEEKRRPGRKFAGGPFSVASKNSGKSMTEIAEALDVKLGTVKAWNAFHRNPPDDIRERLAKKPYSVPSSAWKP